MGGPGEIAAAGDGLRLRTVRAVRAVRDNGAGSGA